MNQTKQERQLNALLEKSRRLAGEARSEKERNCILSMWAGFLAGLRMTNAITQKEYNTYFNELKSLVEELESKGA